MPENPEKKEMLSVEKEKPIKTKQPDTQEIASIERGVGKLIKINMTYWDEKKEHPYIDIREFYLEETKDGETYKATKKGICIPCDILDQLIAGLVQSRHLLDS